MNKELICLLIACNTLGLYGMENKESQNKEATSGQNPVELLSTTNSNINIQQALNSSEDESEGIDEEFFDAYDDENKLEIVKEDWMQKLPVELVQQIILLSLVYENAYKIQEKKYQQLRKNSPDADGYDQWIKCKRENDQNDLTELISDCLRLRINKEWRSILESEYFPWKTIFANFFKNIIENFSKETWFFVKNLVNLKEQIERYENLKQRIKIKSSQNRETTGHTCNGLNHLSTSFNETIENEKFWQNLFTNLFLTMLTEQNQKSLKKMVQEYQNVSLMLTKDTPNDCSQLYLKIMSYFDAILEDVKMNYKIRKAISNFNFGKAKELIEIAKKNKDSNLWRFDLLQSAIKALHNDKNKPLNEENLEEVESNEEVTMQFFEFLISQIINDIDAKGWQGMTALMWAAYYGFDNVIDLLVEKKAHINSRSMFGSTSLMFAAQFGRINAIKKLIDAGADVNDINDNGFTALMYASIMHSNNSIKKLIAAGADVNVINDSGFTALMYASLNGNKEIVEELIKNGANLNINGLDKPGLVKIEKRGLYMQREQTIGTALMQAAANGNYKIMEILINAGADINVVGRNYKTALQMLQEFRN